MCVNLYVHLIMHFCDTVLSQTSILQMFTCTVTLMHTEPHCRFMHVRSERIRVSVSQLLVVCLLHSYILWYSLIDLFLHSCICFQTNTSSEFRREKLFRNLTQWEIKEWDFQKRKIRKLSSCQRSTFRKKTKSKAHLTCLGDSFLFYGHSLKSVWNYCDDNTAAQILSQLSKNSQEHSSKTKGKNKAIQCRRMYMYYV